MADAILTVNDEKSRLIVGFDAETGLLHVDMQRFIDAEILGAPGWATMMTTDVTDLLVST